MRHDLRATGPAFTLRPVEMRDAADIVSLRTDAARGRFLHETSGRVEDQEAWLARYFERPGDFYFAVCRTKDMRFEGTVGVYDVEPGAAEWGRWILREGSFAAVESALLVFRLALAEIGLDQLCCRTLAANESVVGFHDEFGLERVRRLPAYATIRDEEHDAVEHVLTQARFAAIEPAMQKKAERTARLANR